MEWHIQNIALLSIVVLMVSLLTFMIFYMLYRSMHEKKHNKWRMISDMLINQAIFYDERDEIETQILASLTEGAEKLINKRHFRKFLTIEMMSAKRNLAGTSSDGLKLLYTQLGLDKYAVKKLKSRKWHVKAKAIQELTTMDLNEYAAHLAEHTNHPHDLVRMEAQSALVQFNGFEGLVFLDTVTHHISHWQQIKLLQQLALIPPANIDLNPWFKSENHTVVIFALKLARNCNRFELHDDIAACLDHPNPHVRLEAITCVTEIYTEDTSDHLISRFLGESIKHQLAMIKAMQKIGTERDILFLLDLLDFSNDEMRLHAARALAHNTNKNGLKSLEEHAEKTGSPLKEIVMHIKGELAA